MESLSEIKWDVVISGTGLEHSLLALALSRSNKKVLHVDQNEYYGGAEAAFSLQEVDEWIEKVNSDSRQPFRNASLWKADIESSSDSSKLGLSRSYTLTLSPQIIYTKSKLLSQLVSSKVYRQLEFQAVGNWWIYNGEDQGYLKKLPTGREDISQDKSIDNRTKRSLMKFLKFVVDFENQTELWHPHSESGLSSFLASQFQLSRELQTVIAALTLSFEPTDQILVKWALPRIATHLTSFGVFGPGFGAVIPKWGGGAEIAQVACRAGAVGGGVYVLGTGVENTEASSEDAEPRTTVHLSNGEAVQTKHIIYNQQEYGSSKATAISKIIAVVSLPLTSLFQNSIEGSPPAAVSVVTIPSNTLVVENSSQTHPVYIMLHSSETGECPGGQSVLYATTNFKSGSKEILETALSHFLKMADSGEAKLLYSVYYEQEEAFGSVAKPSPASTASFASLDLAFNNETLEEVEEWWKMIMADGNPTEDAQFMVFQDRQGTNDDDDEVNDGV